MRKLFFAATATFWLAIVAFAVAGAPSPMTAPSTKPASIVARYTLAQVAQHATETNCWMAINGVVYDVTPYLPDHPSRPSVVVPWCGKEASNAYQTKTTGRAHSPEADQLLPTYRIGLLQTP